MDTMRYLFFSFMVLFLSCQKERKFNEEYNNFVFSFSAENEDYSIKFTNSDTVYIEKRFPDPKEYFYFLINKNDLDSVYYWVNNIQFSKYNSSYNEHLVNGLVDGIGFKFYLENSHLNSSVYIYGEIGPKEFYVLADKLIEIKERYKLSKTSKKVNFGDLKGILLPIPPPSPI